MKHTTKQISEGKLRESQVINHYCTVNKCTPTDFERELEKAFEQYEERSSHEWVVNIGKFIRIANKKGLEYKEQGLLIGE